MPVPKTSRKPGVINKINYVCSFEACKKDFRTTRKNAKFCSTNCKRSSQILQWASKMVELKQEGKTHRQVAKEFGVSRGAVITRAARLNDYCNKYPQVELVLAMRTSYKGTEDE
jgi:hypothetical protein